MRKTIIAIDFDGTITTKNVKYPNIGPPNEEMISIIKGLMKNKNVELILWTCRSGEGLDMAIKWLEERGIIFQTINKNSDTLSHATSPKIYADIYIDDRVINVNNVTELSKVKKFIRK